MGLLFERVRRGDPGAQEELDRIVRRMAKAVCWRGVPGGGDVDWEDVAQEAAGRLFTVGVHQFRGEGAEESFVYALVRSTALQAARSAARRRKRETVSMPADRPSPDPVEPNLDVRSILGKLPPECARLLEQVFLHGVRYSDLARELGMQESSVRVKVSRCLRKAMEIAGTDSR